jgi:hypothetical protein
MINSFTSLADLEAHRSISTLLLLSGSVLAPVLDVTGTTAIQLAHREPMELSRLTCSFVPVHPSIHREQERHCLYPLIKCAMLGRTD